MSTSISASSETHREGQRPRRRLPWSIVLVGILVLGAIVYLIYANTQSNAAYDLTVSQLRQCTGCLSQAVRVEGTVLKGSIQRDETTQRLAFMISDGSQHLAVAYTGVVPDIFNAGIQVVVEGHYTGQNAAFQAQTLLTKCPSKFTAATPTP
ncbi:MAG TPA: cytochrome c maturation protein CcmE [Ktedonobacteraceae bacterium]